MNTYQDRDFDESTVVGVEAVYSDFEYQVGANIVSATYLSGIKVGAGVAVDERKLIDQYWAERLG